MTEREKFISWVLGLKDSNGEYLYSPAKLRSEFVDGAWQFSCIQVAAMWQGWLSAHQAHTSVQPQAQAAPEVVNLVFGSTREQIFSAIDEAHELSGPLHERIKTLIQQRDKLQSSLPQPQAQGEPEPESTLETADAALSKWQQTKWRTEGPLDVEVTICAASAAINMARIAIRHARQSHREALAKHRAALEECVGDLQAIKATLERENTKPNGPINDTIWHTHHETLFDFVDAAITHANQVLEGSGV